SLLRRCLDRNVQNRLRDVGEARIVLENLTKSSPGDELDGSPTPSGLGRAKFAWVAVLVLAVALSAVGFEWWRSTRPVDRQLILMSVDLGPNAVAGLRTTAILSPDGTRIVFPFRGSTGGARQLATRVLDQPKATTMAGTDGVNDAFFSPDGEWIG